MMNFMADLRELYVAFSFDKRFYHWSISDLRGVGPSLIKFHVKSYGRYWNVSRASFPDLSCASFLKTIILENCGGLEQVVPGMLSPLLESFTFKNNEYYSAEISNISFRGFSQLKSILLEGYLDRLEELDLSGTRVKTLDLRKVKARNLIRLILLGCEKLCAILWPPEDKRTKVLEVLQISTIGSTSPGQANWEEKLRNPIAAMGSSSILAATATEQGINRYASFDFKWYIGTRDTRILRSLEPVKGYIEHRHVYMEMDSSPTSSATVGHSEVAQGIQSRCQPDNYSYAGDIFFQSDLHAGADNEGATGWMWACPASPTPRAQDSYVHIQEKQEMKRGLLKQKQSNIEGINAGASLLPCFIANKTRMLHVHDSSSITCITCPKPQGSCWRWLEWCRVERCPELRTVFYTPQPSDGDSFCYELATFWASELPKACYICDWSAVHMFSFAHIVLLHLDYCPRLIYVLALSETVDTLPHLDTLEIVCCGDLREVFALDPKQKRQRIMECPKLRRIHLYELPSLQHICGSRMSAPNLETVKIRGCWSLRGLPAVSRNNQKLPSVDCEKDWWDNLEWDGVEADHYPSLYVHRHSSYYKAQQPRGTVLR
uniref:Disease resistance protein At4g27190-like leucine-rich repeats domain-containing protein n=2 Tax=Hordeum vulgare subsp. vulgare TaxID=112509 RepID=A0A8I6YP18_HORVV